MLSHFGKKEQDLKEFYEDTFKTILKSLFEININQKAKLASFLFFNDFKKFIKLLKLMLKNIFTQKEYILFVKNKKNYK